MTVKIFAAVGTVATTLTVAWILGGAWSTMASDVEAQKEISRKQQAIVGDLLRIHEIEAALAADRKEREAQAAARAARDPDAFESLPDIDDNEAE